MLDIVVYASGSSGNCYTVSDGETVVMLDCGLPFRRIEQLTGFLLPAAVLVTHEHKDHSKAAQDFMRRGVDVYMTAGTAAALGIEAQHRLHILNPMEQATVGRITVSAFPTQHDAREPCGFLLDDGDDSVLYATDTYYIKYQFPGVTKMLIEANHSYTTSKENVAAHILNKALAERLIKSHFSIENALTFLKANDLSRVKEIWLIHLSDSNADAAEFARMVEATTGKPVYIGGR